MRGRIFLNIIVVAALLLAGSVAGAPAERAILDAPIPLLPDNTAVLYTGIYFTSEGYSWQIALIIAVILAQAGLITAMLQERRRRQLAEVQSRQRMAELAHVNRFSTAGELTASIAHEMN